MRRPSRADREEIRRSQYAALMVLGRCIRRRPMSDMMWRAFVVLTCDDDDAVTFELSGARAQALVA
jgi:hypothetical protein